MIYHLNLFVNVFTKQLTTTYIHTYIYTTSSIFNITDKTSHILL